MGSIDLYGTHGRSDISQTFYKHKVEGLG